MKALLPLLLLLSAACAGGGRRAEEAFVDPTRLDPNLVLDIRYATPDNFTHQIVYAAARCVLRKTVADQLAAAAKDLEARGYRLKIYDCYRPLTVQKRFWSLVPDPRYVADPRKGSVHNRGAAVDVSLTDKNGVDVEMPSGYDDFSERARRDWDRATPDAAKHRAVLEKAMLDHGFLGLMTEWWHFDAYAWKQYPISDVPVENIP